MGGGLIRRRRLAGGTDVVIGLELRPRFGPEFGSVLSSVDMAFVFDNELA